MTLKLASVLVGWYWGSFAFGQAAVPNLASGLLTVTLAGPLRRFDFAGGAERERHQIVNATPPMLANNLTSDTRKYKVLSIMFSLVATNNPRGLNSGRARDKTRTLRLCLKRYQKQRASPKRVSTPTSHTGCVCYRMVAGQCFSRRLARRQQVLRHGASQKDLHDRHAPLFLSRERRKKLCLFTL